MAPQSDDYVFTRDLLDNSRLNLMHHYYVKDFGYLIHPNIPTQGENLKVADVGSGTGMWLVDASDRLHESTQLVGLDISFDAAPPPEALPSNITLQRWDVNDAVPDGLLGAFDIINVRFMVFVVRKDDVPATVGKLVQMLKPGGHLQWMEPDNQTVHGEVTKPENKKESIEALMRLLQSQDPRLNPTWVPDLPGVFRDAGLEDVEADVHTTPPHWAYLEHECGLIMHELIARKTQNEAMAAELKRLIPLAVEETKRGAYLATTKYAVVGRKRR
ncbi:S-adenosyl-L-methionine-dependent methyltransferase [Apiospora saccharicola]|uniref:S-adenosyl-L-methionine-dependent methyltransferase n=1 Tax=Apiospora saccharicola TaxID=335842 RepID=A0ABR1UDN3_9PEZI